MDVFEQLEQAVQKGYYDDPRWKEVSRLRRGKEHAKADELSATLRKEWGLNPGGLIKK
jgi:hypothetical protein